jgi:hypothetical protein
MESTAAYGLLSLAGVRQLLASLLLGAVLLLWLWWLAGGPPRPPRSPLRLSAEKGEENAAMRDGPPEGASSLGGGPGPPPWHSPRGSSSFSARLARITGGGPGERLGEGESEVPKEERENFCLGPSLREKPFVLFWSSRPQAPPRPALVF